MRRRGIAGRMLQALAWAAFAALLAGLAWSLLRRPALRDEQVGLAAAVDQAKAEPAKNASYKLMPGPYEVGEVREVILHDTRRGKDLPVRILYPTGNETFPVLIFSHGAGGSKECCTDLTRHWASYGYVVLQPTHADSLRLQRGRGEQVVFRGAVAGALRNPAAWANRARDVSLIIDSFAELESRVPALKGKMDSKRIGVGGHSLGAYTAQLIGGATVDTPEGKARSFADERVRAVLLLSGQGRGQQGLTEHSWDNLARPMMTMTGSRDLGAAGQGPEWKKEPFDFSPPGDKYHVFIEGAHHGSFTGGLSAGPRAQQGGGADQGAVFSYVEIATIAFWDAYLKSDAKAKAYLLSDSLASYSGGAVKLYRK